MQGSIAAIDRQKALSDLVGQGYFLTQLEPEKAAASIQRRWLRPGIAQRDLAVLLRQISVLYTAGIPIITVLETVQMQYEADTRVAHALEQMRRQLAGGAGLAVAMQRTSIFPPLVVNMIAAGEAGGTLEIALERAATHLEQQHERQQQIRSALAYPRLLAVLIVGITWFLLAWVLPQYDGIFAAWEMPLPVLTRALLSIGRYLREYSRWLLLLSVTLVFLWRCFARSPTGRAYLHSAVLRLPWRRRLNEAKAVVNLGYALSSLLASGMNLLGALPLVQQTMDNQVYAAALDTVIRAVANGSSLASQLAATGLFPPLALQLIAAGESSGTLEKTLRQAAAYYEQDLRFWLTRWGKLLEPVIILVLAIIVGVLGLAITLPVMQMYQFPM